MLSLSRGDVYKRQDLYYIPTKKITLQYLYFSLTVNAVFMLIRVLLSESVIFDKVCIVLADLCPHISQLS